MLLEALHRSFPQAAEVWGMLRSELPSDVEQKLERSLSFPPCLGNTFNSSSACAAPTTLMLWLLHITNAFPLLAINRRRAALNEAVDKSDTISKRTALFVKHTKTTTYDKRI